MNIVEHVFLLHAGESSEYMPWSGIAKTKQNKQTNKKPKIKKQKTNNLKEKNPPKQKKQRNKKKNKTTTITITKQKKSPLISFYHLHPMVQYLRVSSS